MPHCMSGPLPVSLGGIGCFLRRDFFDDVAVAAGAVLDAAVDPADGGRADLHRFDDLVIGAATQKQL